MRKAKMGVRLGASSMPLLSDAVSSEEEPSEVGGSSLSPCSVLCLLLGVLTVVNVAVTLWVWVLEFLLFWGKRGCLQKHNSQSAFQDFS